MDRYESLSLVGEGSYGAVLKCRHRDSGRLVAIKKFVDSDDDKTVKKIAQREVKLLRRLRHDNLVSLLEVWRRRRRWYLVFEFVERTLLDDLEQHPTGLHPETCRRYLYQTLRAAAFCHQHHIIHRDIKPENVLISRAGVVKLCDFGFARTVMAAAEGAAYTAYVATRWYRAPELLVGDTRYGKPVDVWSVGCLLVEMFSGRPLFPGDSDLDQIHHILGCLGNLTARHQELFYRNPVFSGVRLPESCGRVSMEQRFPNISPTVLDLAQSCLQMDPEARAQCSQLLQHSLFTQDSFHIRVLDELNAKIQKEHRENSTLPKIAKNSRQEKEEGDEKKRRAKDKKQPEDVLEKVNKERDKKEKEAGEEKTAKTKSKQPSKPAKISKQSKTSHAKVAENAPKPSVSNRRKPGKVVAAELRKEVEVCEFTAEHSAAEGKLKREKTPSTQQEKDRESNLLICSDNTGCDVGEKNLKGNWRSLKNDVGNTKVPKLPKSSLAENSNGDFSPKTCLKPTTDCAEIINSTIVSITEFPECAASSTTWKISSSDQSEIKKAPQHSRNDKTEVATPTFPVFVKQKSAEIEHQIDNSVSETKQRWTSGCPLNPEASDCGPKMSKNSSFLSSSPSKTHFIEDTATTPAGILQTGSFSGKTPTKDIKNPPRQLPTNGGLKEGPPAIKTPTCGRNCEVLNEEDPRCCKINPNEETPTDCESGSTSMSKIAIKSGKTSTMSPKEVPKMNLSEGKTCLKTPKVSGKENREDFLLSVSTGAATTSLESQISKVSRSSNMEKKDKNGSEPNMEPSKPPMGELEAKFGVLNAKSGAVVAPKPPKSILPTEERKKREHAERKNQPSVTDSTSFTPSDFNLTQNSAFVDEFGSKMSSPPPPPPPPSSTPLLIPPSSTPLLIPSFSAASERFTTRPNLQPTHSLRCSEKLHAGQRAQRTITSQKSLAARERSFLSDRGNHGNSAAAAAAATAKKSGVHFPDLRHSALPELRGREGKHNKGLSKDQRKEKPPLTFIFTSQNHGHNNTG